MEPILLKGIHRDIHKDYEIFWDVEMKNGDFGKSKKTKNRNGHAFWNVTINSK